MQNTEHRNLCKTKIKTAKSRIRQGRSTDMEIILSSTSGRPIYEQITLQIKEMIMKGILPPGTLPSMRKLAKDLHVALSQRSVHMTICKEGFIVTVPAKGTFVSTENQDFIREENLRRIEQLLTDAAFLAKKTGFQ